MKIVGLIAEYNPFHNGHKYHIEKAKELTGADYVVVVMSGNFVQRGTPAIMPKHERTEVALQNGASLVIELPSCYATGTAEQFAYGAVSILDKLGCVAESWFGSECGDIKTLRELAQILHNESSEYKELLQDLLRTGLSFPAARQEAIKMLYPDKNYDQILESPNNILGIEYIKALYALNSKMIPVTIERKFSNYNDSDLCDGFSSASAIRNKIEEHLFSDIADQVPAGNIDMYFRIFEQRFPIYPDDLSLLLKYRLLNETKSSLMKYADVSEELANRIFKQRNQFVSFEQFCNHLKTKELTYSRISRALLHILLEIKDENYTEIEYAHVLGFSLKDATVMSLIKKYSSIPLMTKLTASEELSSDATRMLEQDIYVSNLYESVITDKFKTSFINEYEHPIVRI